MDLGNLAQMGQGVLKNAAGSDNAASSAVLSLIPKDMLDKLPEVVKMLAASQAVDKLAKEAPELLGKIKAGGKLTGADAEKLKAIAVEAFQSAVKSQGQ